PGDLAEVEMRGSMASVKELEGLVPNEDIVTHAAPAPEPAPTTPAPESAVEPPPEALPTPESAPAAPATKAPRYAKWATLPRRDPSTRVRNVPEHYGYPPDESGEPEERDGQHRAYVAFEENEPKTYQEAMTSTCSK
ncbi:hypothetical protein DXG01_000612, partial [Tephrocybe rancida]